MYLIKTSVSKSPIEGLGVFAEEAVEKGTVVWKFTSSHDKSLPISEFDKLDPEAKKELEKIGYISPLTCVWIYPPENDPARFTNHSETNNLSVTLNPQISEEPIFVANKSIIEGEELTVNYLEFDEHTKQIKPEWIGNL